MSVAAPSAITPLTQLPAWKALESHHKIIGSQTLGDLFAKDLSRGTRLAIEAEGIYLDYSKHRITDETLKLLLQLAEQLISRPASMPCSAAKKSTSPKNRAVLHIALRAPKGETIKVDGKNVVPEVHEVLDRMAAFSDRDPQRRMEGPHRQADPKRHQHRHRRLRPRAGHGLRGAAPLQPTRHDLPLRLQRRRHRLRRSHPRPRS